MSTLRSSARKRSTTAVSAVVSPTRSSKRFKTVQGSDSTAPNSLKLIIPEPDPAPALTSPFASAKPPSLAVHLPSNVDFEDARRHLTSADPRFGPLFEKLRCKPFQGSVEGEDAEDSSHTLVNPFRSLMTSILGQQVSWLAARAIIHKFQRLFFPELPEKYEAGLETPFPTPEQVFKTSLTTLRTAGLSQRKAEYVVGLAEQFIDGRLSSEMLVSLSDEEVSQRLIAVRGIGPWTVDMFLIFTARRPDVLPVGDLGIQKGLLRWYCEDDPIISARKLAVNGKESTSEVKASLADLAQSLATPPSTPEKGKTGSRKTPVKPSIVPSMGLATPPATPTKVALPPIPESSNLSRAQLKSRLQKKAKGVYLTPSEMEQLTQHWRPYRSIACWYLWSLTDAPE